MSALRGLTAPLLTLATGGFTALAVAFASFALLWQAAGTEQGAFEERLTLVAQLGAMNAAPWLAPAAAPPPTEPPAAESPDVAPPSPSPTPDGSLQALLQPLKQTGHTLQVAVLDPNGTVLAAAAAVEGAGARSVEAAARLCGPLEREIVVPVYTDPSGARTQAACAPVRAADGAVLGRVIALDDPTWLDHQEQQEVESRAVVMGVAALVGLMVIFGVRTLLSPFREVAAAAERMAAGERGVRVAAAGSPEVLQVASALNELASAVEAREDEIRSRLAGITQLTSMVAHEVRNPLQSLSLLCSLARTEEDEDEREKLLTSIEAEINALEGVVQRFLRSSGPLQISRVQADLVEVANLATKVANAQARTRQVELTTSLPNRLPMHADASLIRRAIENLLLNAIEFSGQEPPGKVALAIARRGREAVITVDDNGPGVPQQERDRIFKAYYSSKAGGTGLGLALVKQVFQAHGGTIRCEASPLGGARFTATLPIEGGMEVPFAS